MTSAELGKAIYDQFAAIAKRTTSSTIKSMCAAGQALGQQVPGLFPPITERRRPNHERRVSDATTTNGALLVTLTEVAGTPTPIQGWWGMRQRQRRGGIRISRQDPPAPGPGPVTKLAMSTQPAGAVDSTLFGTGPVVKLQDADSVDVIQAGVAITASINSGSGALSGTLTVQTTSGGIAPFTDLKVVGSGAHTLAFAASGLTGVNSSSFTVAAITKLAMVTQPADASDGTAFGTQPAVRLQTAASANATKSGVTVTVSKASGSGTLSGTTSANTDANGVAQFTNLVITGTGAHTLAFASTGLTGVNSGSFTVAAVGGTATKVVMVTQPAGARDSTAFDTQPVVRLQDANSANVTQAGVSVTVAKASGSGTLSGTLTVATDANGIATFVGLSIAGSGSHTLSFNSANLTGVTSASFTVNVATKLAITTQPSNGVIAVALVPNPVITLQDANSLVVAKNGVAVTVTKATGPGTLSGTLSVNTGGNGTAGFSNLLFDTAGTCTLAFASTGLTGVNSGTFTVAASQEPPDYILVAERAFDAVEESPWSGVNLGNGSIVSDSTAPRSPANVLRVRQPAGFEAGNTVYGPQWVDFPNSKELYIAWWFKFSANFEGVVAGMQKMFYIWSSGLGGSKPDRPHTTLCWMASGASQSGVSFRLQDLGYPITWPGDPLAVNYQAGSAPRDQWHRAEVILIANTPGVQNGVAKWWHNGSLIMNITDVAWFGSADPAHFNSVALTSIWGGNGTATVAEQYWYFDHLRVSRKV